MDNDNDNAWVDEHEDDLEMFINAMNSGNFGEAFDVANGPLGFGFPIPSPGLFDAMMMSLCYG